MRWARILNVRRLSFFSVIVLGGCPAWLSLCQRLVGESCPYHKLMVDAKSECFPCFNLLQKKKKITAAGTWKLDWEPVSKAVPCLPSVGDREHGCWLGATTCFCSHGKRAGELLWIGLTWIAFVLASCLALRLRSSYIPSVASLSLLWSAVSSFYHKHKILLFFF